jgi:MFS family permease
MATLCGAAMSFLQLFLFRIGVGVGEAGAGPASHSLISDYFTKAQRPTALGIFSLGVPLGTFLGIYLGGMLVDWIGWRWTFVALGAPGVLLALIVWLHDSRTGARRPRRSRPTPRCCARTKTYRSGTRYAACGPARPSAS